MTGTGKKPPEKRPLRITLQKNVPRKKTPTEMLPTKEAPPTRMKSTGKKPTYNHFKIFELILSTFY